MLHSYSAPDVTQCFEGRHIVFIGDSTVRQVFCESELLPGSLRELEELTRAF